MDETPKPSRIGLNYGVMIALIMITVFIMQQFIPIITPSRLSIINLCVLATGLTIVPLTIRKQNEGFMTFAQGFGPNVIIILVSSAISASFIYLYVKFVDDFYLQALKEARLDALRAQMSEERAQELVGGASRFFNAEFIMIPLLLSKLVLGFVFTLVIVGILSKREPAFADR